MVLPPRAAAFVAVLSATALAAAGGCSPEAHAPERPPAYVQVAKPVVEKNVQEREEFLGRLEAMETVQVQARVFGYLDKILFTDGQLVEKGQPLFEIDPSTYQAIYNQNVAKVEVARARLKVNEANFARSKKLFERAAVTKEELDEALAAKDEAIGHVAEAEADAAKSKLDLDFTKISSPIKGRVDRAFVTLGNLVTGGQTGGTTLTQVVSVDPIYVYFEVDDKLSAKYWKILQKSKADTIDRTVVDWKLPVWVTTPNTDDPPREGYLDFTETKIDPGSATRQVRGVIPNDDRRFSAGQFVTTQIAITPPYDAMSIEGRAVQSDLTAKKFVYVVGKDDKVEQRYIVLGPKQGTRQVVKSGLKPDDRVIVSGFQRVRPGDVATIVEPKKQPAESEAASEATAAAAAATATPAGSPAPASTSAAPAASAPADPSAVPESTKPATTKPATTKAE